MCRKLSLMLNINISKALKKHLKFVDTESDWQNLRSPPNQSVAHNSAHILLDLFGINRIIPRLHIENDVRFCDRSRLLRLFLRIRLQKCIGLALLLLVIAVIVSKQIEIILKKQKMDKSNAIKITSAAASAFAGVFSLASEEDCPSPAFPAQLNWFDKTNKIEQIINQKWSYFRNFIGSNLTKFLKIRTDPPATTLLHVFLSISHGLQFFLY